MPRESRGNNNVSRSSLHLCTHMCVCACVFYFLIHKARIATFEMEDKAKGFTRLRKRFCFSYQVSDSRKVSSCEARGDPEIFCHLCLTDMSSAFPCFFFFFFIALIPVNRVYLKLFFFFYELH